MYIYQPDCGGLWGQEEDIWVDSLYNDLSCSQKCTLYILVGVSNDGISIHKGVCRQNIIGFD